MFTKCPECNISFRVTAKVLQQANGNVRCGGCNHAFNALNYLSEEMPNQGNANNESDELAETSRRLLETLDELAGPEEVRIEDTGVEWRVLDKDASSSADADDVVEEMRYDDSTLLPDDFGLEGEESYVAPEPVRRAADQDVERTPEFDAAQQDFMLSEPDEWTDLLDEVSDPEPEEVSDPEPEAESLEVEEELAAIHNQLSARDSSPSGDSLPADIDAQFDTQAEAMGLETTSSEDALTDQVPLLDEGGADDVAEEVEDAEDESADETAGDADEDEVAAADDLADDDEDEIAASDDLADDDEDEEDASDESSENPEIIDEDDGDLSDDLRIYDEDDDEAPDELVAIDDGSNDATGEFPVSDVNELLHESVDEEDDDATDDDDDVELDSTGEFEEQIDVAARALLGEEDTPEDSEDEISAAEDEDEDEEVDLELEGDSGSDDDSAEAEHIVPDPTEKEMTVNMEIDQEMMALAMKDDDFTATLVGLKSPEELFEENADAVETIVMEGDFVRGSVEKERLAAENAAKSQLDDPTNLADTYAMRRGKLRGGRRRYDPASYGITGAIVILVLSLAGQYIHNSRESLATMGFFNQTIAPVYRMLGNPVTPSWDIKGWQFEVTNGNVDDAETTLTIVSRIVNRTESPLPDPLVHVSLTDRWEENMGSRILEPGDYLAGDLDPSSPVQPGENFTAVITIEDPSTEATGFKLNVSNEITPLPAS